MTGKEAPTSDVQSGVTSFTQHQARVPLSFCSCCVTCMSAGPSLHRLTPGVYRLHVGSLWLETLHEDNTSM